STHKSPPVQRWLRRHPRFHFHFTPTSSSWLNLVERWFRDLSQKRIRRGSFESVEALIAAIEQYLATYNTNPTRFTWTKDADMILAKIDGCKAALGTAHKPRMHAQRLGASHGEAARALLARMSLLELSPPLLPRPSSPSRTPVRTLEALHLASMEFLRR